MVERSIIFFKKIKKQIIIFFENEQLITQEMLSPLYTTVWGVRASWIVASAIGLFILVTFCQMINNVYHDAVTQSSSRSSPVFSEKNESQIMQDIPNYHLFGKLGGEGAVPITSLQLKLMGVTKTLPEEKSHVIISEENQPGKVYRVGDSLSSGIVINRIVDDGVILENDGQFEKLPLQRSILQFQDMPTAIL